MNLVTRILPALACLLLLVSCNTAPHTGRSRVLLSSEADENEMGAQLYTETVQEGPVASGPQADRVRRIGWQLAQVSDHPEWEWEFTLIESDQPNAFCLPGGKVAVYTGLLPVLDNEDQLAAVMGHEIAHAILRHGGERMSNGAIVDASASVLAVMTGGTPDSQARLKTVYGMIGQGALLPYSRSHESEADYVGLKFMAMAGYDPREAPKLWQNMAELGGARPPEWMSTHPSNETRIARIESHLPEVMPLYEQARRARP